MRYHHPAILRCRQGGENTRQQGELGGALVDTYSTPTLMRMLAAGQIDPSQFVTHRFGIDEMLEAYDVFSQAGDTDALKVVLFST